MLNYVEYPSSVKEGTETPGAFDQNGQRFYVLDRLQEQVSRIRYLLDIGRRMRCYPRMEASTGFLSSPCHKNRPSRSQSPWPCGMMFTMICSPI